MGDCLQEFYLLIEGTLFASDKGDCEGWPEIAGFLVF